MPLACGLYYHVYHSEKVEAPPVVLLHGAGGTSQSWPAQIRRLGGFRVFALDLPGHGKSDQGGGYQSIRAYADHLLDWLSAMGLHQAVFVGHSMGGAIALELAIDNAEHVIGLGLVATGARLHIQPELLADASSPATFNQTVDFLVSHSFTQQASPGLVRLAAKRLAQIRPGVLYGDLLASASFDRMDRLGKIFQPVIILCGAEDEMTPVRSSQILLDLIPGAELELIPRAGHMVMLEQPEVVARALQTFLNRLVFVPGGKKYRVYRY